MMKTATRSGAVSVISMNLNPHAKLRIHLKKKLKKLSHMMPFVSLWTPVPTKRESDGGER